MFGFVSAAAARLVGGNSVRSARYSVAVVCSGCICYKELLYTYLLPNQKIYCNVKIGFFLRKQNGRLRPCDGALRVATADAGTTLFVLKSVRQAERLIVCNRHLLQAEV